MSKNTQALILFFASQFSWLVCCAASAPAFIATTYESTVLQYLLMANGIFITGSGTILLVLAILVAMSKKDELSPQKLDPKFSIGMGGTAFLLILQVILSVGHAALQPDEADFVKPEPNAVAVYEFEAELKDGQSVGGAYGFVIAHPADGRPIFVTVSQQFGTDWGIDRDLDVAQIRDSIATAGATPLALPEGGAITLGPAIAFKADAFLASGYGMQDPWSDVLFFEAPGMESTIAPVKLFDGLDQAPSGQILYARDTEGTQSVELRFDYDLDEVWEIDGPENPDIVAGTPILDYQYRIVGFVTRSDESKDIDAFPMHIIYDYLGHSVR